MMFKSLDMVTGFIKFQTSKLIKWIQNNTLYNRLTIFFKVKHLLSLKQKRKEKKNVPPMYEWISTAVSV